MSRTLQAMLTQCKPTPRSSDIIIDVTVPPPSSQGRLSSQPLSQHPVHHNIDTPSALLATIHTHNMLNLAKTAPLGVPEPHPVHITPPSDARLRTRHNPGTREDTVTAVYTGTLHHDTVKQVLVLRMPHPS